MACHISEKYDEKMTHCFITNAIRSLINCRFQKCEDGLAHMPENAELKHHLVPALASQCYQENILANASRDESRLREY